MVLQIIIAFLISWLVGTISLQLISLFSTDNPPIYPDLVVGAFILELCFFAVKMLPWLLFWLFFGGIIWIVIKKLINIKSPYGFFGAMFYISIKVVISLFLVLARL